MSEMLRDLMRSAALDPSKRVALADALVAAGRVDDALKLCEREIARVPKELPIRLAYSRVLLAAGRVDDAQRALAEAMQAPDSKRAPSAGAAAANLLAAQPGFDFAEDGTADSTQVSEGLPRFETDSGSVRLKSGGATLEPEPLPQVPQSSVTPSAVGAADRRLRVDSGTADFDEEMPTSNFDAALLSKKSAAAVLYDDDLGLDTTRRRSVEARPATAHKEQITKPLRAENRTEAPSDLGDTTQRRSSEVAGQPLGADSAQAGAVPHAAITKGLHSEGVTAVKSVTTPSRNRLEGRSVEGRATEARDSVRSADGRAVAGPPPAVAVHASDTAGAQGSSADRASPPLARTQHMPAPVLPGVGAESLLSAAPAPASGPAASPPSAAEPARATEQMAAAPVTVPPPAQGAGVSPLSSSALAPEVALPATGQGGPAGPGAAPGSPWGLPVKGAAAAGSSPAVLPSEGQSPRGAAAEAHEPARGGSATRAWVLAIGGGLIAGIATGLLLRL
jgi:hypothetical protein